MAVLQLAKSC